MNSYEPANVSHNDLLKYHLQVSTKVDNEIAVREARKTLALLDNPPKHQTHQHAEISHDAQKTAVNLSNEAVVKRVDKDKKELAKEKKVAKAKPVQEYKVLSPEEVAVNFNTIQQQISTAASKTVTPTTVAADTSKGEEKKPAEATNSQAATPPWLAGK